MYRFPRLAQYGRYFAIHTTDEEAQRIGRLLQFFLAIVLLGLSIRLGIRIAGDWGSPDIFFRAVGPLIGLLILIAVSYNRIQKGQSRGVAHLIFLSLFIGEMVVLWPTAVSTQQHAPFILLYLVGAMGILAVRHSGPYAFFPLLAAVRMNALGLDATRFIIASLSIGLTVWVIARAHKNALRQAKQASQELATLNATLQEQVAQRTLYLNQGNERLQKGLDIGRATSVSLNLDEQVHNAVRLIREQFGFSHVAILLLDESNRHLVLREATGDVGRRQKQAGYRVAMGEPNTLVSVVAEQREARQVSTAESRFQSPLHLQKSRAELALPLLTRNFLVGVLSVQSDTADTFSAEDITILQVVADQLANNIENGLLFTELEQRTTNLTKLQAVIPLMSEQINTQNALHVLAQQASELAHAEGAGIMLWNAGEDVLEGVLQTGETLLGLVGEKQAANQGLAGRCFANNETINLNNYHAWEGRLLRESNAPVMATMAVPIRERGTPLGVLLVARQTNPDPFSADEVQLVELLASQAGTVITNQQLLEETQQLANRERQLNQMAAEIRRNLDTEMVLESAVQNLGRLLHDQRITVRLYPSSQTQQPTAET
jgi:GAF domain-containing protein